MIIKRWGLAVEWKICCAHLRFIYLSATKKIKRLIAIKINAASDHLSTSIAIKY